MSLALSTSWNAFRHTDGFSLINEITALGFDSVELSFNLTAGMVDEVEKLVLDRRIHVTSLHNCCPVPPEVERTAALPDYYSMSSLDDSRRKRAVELAKTTIDTAVRLHAEAVVLHCGRVEIPDRTVDLIALFNKGGRRSEAFASLRDEIVRERTNIRKQFLENTLASLDVLNAYAAGKRIKLGVETRYYYREIPFFDEIKVILDTFRDSQVYYWHDTGHAQLMENLGFLRSHEEFLTQYGNRMIGIHIHDITGCSDHQPPGTGEIDFSMLKPYVSGSTIKVIEAHHPATGAQLTKAAEFVKNLFNG